MWLAIAHLHRHENHRRLVTKLGDTVLVLVVQLLHPPTASRDDRAKHDQDDEYREEYDRRGVTLLALAPKAQPGEHVAEETFKATTKYG